MDCLNSKFEVATNNSLQLYVRIRSRGSGRFHPWHQQMRGFAGAAGRAFRHPGRQHCGALSGLGEEREERSCKLHVHTDAVAMVR